jgi:hypothetical protein
MHIGVGSQRHASAWRPALVLAASIAAVGVLAQSMDPNPSRAQAVRESTADRDVIASRAGGIVGSKHDYSAAGPATRRTSPPPRRRCWLPGPRRRSRCARIRRRWAI